MNSTANVYNLFFIVCFALMFSCSKDESIDDPTTSEEEAEYYSLGVQIPDGASYSLSTDDLMTGNISPVGNGVEIPGNEFIQSGNYFYFFSRGEKKFFQYEMHADGSVTETASLLVSEYITDRAYSRNLIDENTILVMDPIQWGEPEIKWFTIKIPEFEVSNSGVYSIPTIAKDNGENWKANLGTAVVHGNKLVMPTVYYDFDGNYAPGTRSVVLDYPSMDNETLIESDISTGENAYINNLLAHTDNGDLYIGYLRGFYGTPTDDDVNGYILRINAGETDFDDSYFFDLSAEMGEPTQVMQLDALEGNWAMGMLFNPNDIGEYSNLDNDHYYYAKVDLANQSITRYNMPKADIRLSRKPLISEGNFIAFHKSAANNTTNVLVIDYNGNADDYTIGKTIDGDGVTGYSVVKHPTE